MRFTVYISEPPPRDPKTGNLPPTRGRCPFLDEAKAAAAELARRGHGVEVVNLSHPSEAFPDALATIPSVLVTGERASVLLDVRAVEDLDMGRLEVEPEPIMATPPVSRADALLRAIGEARSVEDLRSTVRQVVEWLKEAQR